MEPEARYERIWRLIHVCEATTVCLGAVAASRLLWLRDRESTSTELRDVCEKAVARVVRGEGEGGRPCLDGVIDSWLQLLSWLRKHPTDLVSQDPVISELVEFLTDECPSGLVAIYPSIGLPGPTNPNNRLGLMLSINQIRNKVAHVPLPTMVVTALEPILRQEVETLLSGKRFDLLDGKRSVHAALRGRVRIGEASVDGSQFSKAEEPVERTSLQHGDECWPAFHLVFVDSDLKVSLLYRVAQGLPDFADEPVVGEYYRFAAETEPARRVENIDLSEWASPRVSTEEATADELSRMRPDELRGDADDAMREQNFEQALILYEELARRPADRNYNDVARSRHGGTLWRVARHETDDQKAQVMFRDAVKLLKIAQGHADPRYSARAAYESSKATYYAWRRGFDWATLESAIKNAQAAAEYYEPNYQAWLELLLRQQARSAREEFEPTSSPTL